MQLVLALFLTFSSLLTTLVDSGRVPSVPDSATTTLTIRVTNVREASGRLWVGIYEGEHDFLDRHRARLVYVDVLASGSALVELPDMVVDKEYALAVFHDLNNDGDLNCNWLGLPSEPWAFSGEPNTRLRLPYFEEVSFRVTAEGGLKEIRLRMF